MSTNPCPSHCTCVDTCDGHRCECYGSGRVLFIYSHFVCVHHIFFALTSFLLLQRSELSMPQKSENNSFPIRLFAVFDSPLLVMIFFFVVLYSMQRTLRRCLKRELTLWLNLHLTLHLKLLAKTFIKCLH